MSVLRLSSIISDYGSMSKNKNHLWRVRVIPFHVVLYLLQNDFRDYCGLASPTLDQLNHKDVTESHHSLKRPIKAALQHDDETSLTSNEINADKDVNNGPVKRCKEKPHLINTADEISKMKGDFFSFVKFFWHAHFVSN